MEEKASLMIASAKKGEEIKTLQDNVEKLILQLNNIPSKCAAEKLSLEEKAREDFIKNKENKIISVKEIIANKRAEIDSFLDSIPGMEKKEFAGRVEIKGLEEHLKTIYPDDMIEDYNCMNPYIFDNDGEAYQAYSNTESLVYGMKNGNIIGTIFDGITNLLISMSDSPKIGLKILPILFISILGCIFLSPFIFLSMMSLIGVVSVSRGLYVSNTLRKLYSIKLYLNESYNEDIFQKDKNEVIGFVDEFLNSVENDYLEVISEEHFEFDRSILDEIDSKYSNDKQNLSIRIDNIKQDIQIKQDELKNIIERIDEIEKEEQEFASRAVTRFLGSINWKKEWLENIFIEVTNDNKVKVMPFAKGNSLYYSRDLEQLKMLSRLIVFQTMLNMHPDFASTFVLDYKYNGGELTQFVTVPDNFIKVCYIKEELDKQLEFIGNELRARTNNILGSCESIEDFNKLMESYNTTGERYVIVNVFGLNTINDIILNFLRNGPRVGYYFKFYCTFDELKDMKDSLHLEYFNEIFEILDNPKPRQATALNKMLESK